VTGKLFDGVAPAFRADTSVSNVYSAFGNTWFSGDVDAFLPVGSVIGALFVTKNWTSIFFEDYNPENPAKIGGRQFVKAFETITIVPEPSTLLLLAGGLVGLLAYAWRKRK
jgi:hypothetical protein